MSDRNTQTAIVVPGVSIKTLKRLPRVHDRFDEGYLQELLRDHPELLPITDIRSDAGQLLCIGREIAVASGSIDNLYLSTSGYPVIVETKLWRNPEARRQVLAQVLDYIKDVARKDFDWIDEQWEVCRKPHDGTLVAALSKLASEELDESLVIDRVNRALERGDVIAMVVGDGIEARLRDLVEHLKTDSPRLKYSLALVELACYVSNDASDEQILVVPRIVKSVEPVQRAYIHLDIADRLKGQLTVESLVEPEPEPGRRARVTLNEEDFLKEVESSAGPKCRNEMQKFYQELVNSFGVEPEFKASAIMLKVPDPEDERPGVSVLALEKAGRIYNTEFLPHQLARWDVPEAAANSIAEKYWKALNALDPRFDASGIVHLASGRFLPFMELSDKLPLIKEEVGKVVGQIRAAAAAAQEAERK